MRAPKGSAGSASILRGQCEGPDDYQSLAGADLGPELHLTRAPGDVGFLVSLGSTVHTKKQGPVLDSSGVRNKLKGQRQEGPMLTMICVWTAAPLTSRAQEPPFHSRSGLTSQWHCPAKPITALARGPPVGTLCHLAPVHRWESWQCGPGAGPRSLCLGSS